MSARVGGSPLKSAPLGEPGQSLRNVAIDLVFGRFVPSLWLLSIAWVLAFRAWLAQAFGWHFSSEMHAFVALGLSVVLALQFYLVSKEARSWTSAYDG